MVWQVLLVEDDLVFVTQIKDDATRRRLLPNGEACSVSDVSNFELAIGAMAERRFDYLILDLRAEGAGLGTGAAPGKRVFNALRSQHFVPVVFYTALPQEVQEFESPFVRIVEKTMGIRALRRELKAIHDTRLPELRHRLEEEQRTYMWDFVEKNASNFASGRHHADLAYLLARRLALSLSGETVRSFLSPGTAVPSQTIHPIEFYVRPPIGTDWRAGDIVRKKAGGARRYFVVLSPTCDFTNSKVEVALLSRCSLMSTQAEYTAWKGQTPPRNDKSLKKRLGALSRGRNSNGRQEGRFRFLPGTFFLPDLLTDFQALLPIPVSGMSRFDRVASLDSPIAEAILLQFGRYYARIGTPELDTDAVMARISTGGTRRAGPTAGTRAGV